MTISFKEVLFSSGSARIKSIKLLDFIIGSIFSLCIRRRKLKEIPSIIKHILIIRPGGMGDAIFLLPVINAIKSNDSTIKIDILCEKRNAQVFQSQPQWINEIFYLDQLTSLKKCIRHHYDVVFDTEQWHYLSAIIASLIPKAYSVGFLTRRNRDKFFNQAVNYNLDTYELDSFRELFQSCFPIVKNMKSLEGSFRISDNLHNWANNLIPTKSVSFFVGGSLPQKKLTDQQNIAIAQFLINRNLTPVLLGGSDAIETGNNIKTQMKENLFINLIDKTNLMESAAAIKKTKLFIGTDSGLLHLACSLGIPTISFWGSSNPKKWGPKGQTDLLINDHVACSPCTHYSYSVPTCHGTFFCIKNMSIESMIKQINLHLKTIFYE